MDFQFLQSLVQLNFLPVCVCIFLVYFLIINHTYEKNLTNQLHPIVILLLILIVLDNLDYYLIDTLDTGIKHRAVSMLGYDVRIFILAGLISIVVERLFVDKSKYIYIPAIINAILILPCLFTDWVFTYAEDCSIIRGPLAYTPHIISGIYVFFLMYLGIFNMFISKLQEGILIFIEALLCILAVFVEMHYQLRGILIGIIAFNIIFYYMYLHIEHFRYDVLTGAYNKEAFYSDVKKFGKRNITAICSVDMNNLKDLNDSKGHLEGDKALKRVAKAILINLNRNCFLYRVGGDEFVIICTRINYKLVLDLMTKLTIELTKLGDICAIGSAEWTNDLTFEEVYNKADSIMYENKIQIKQVTGQKLR